MFNLTDDQYFQVFLQIFGGFTGAFFALLLGYLSFVYKNKRDRIIKHQNAVVSLEYLLNEHLDDIATNQYLIKGTVEIFDNNHFTYNRLHTFRLIEDLELRIADIDLINKNFSYKISAQRINSDILALNRSLDILQDMLMSGSVDMSTFEKNLKHISSQLLVIDQFLQNLTEENKELLIYIRVYMRLTFNKPVLVYWKTQKILKYFINRERLDKEKEELNKEIKDIKKESKEKIDKIINIEKKYE